MVLYVEEAKTLILTMYEIEGEKYFRWYHKKLKEYSPLAKLVECHNASIKVTNTPGSENKIIIWGGK